MVDLFWVVVGVGIVYFNPFSNYEDGGDNPYLSGNK